MIRSFIFLLTAVLISSCATSGRIVEMNDHSKDIQGIKLIQNLIAQSADDSILASNARSYSVSMIYLLKQQKNERPTLFLDIQVRRPLPSEKPDSVMYVNLDNEKIRIASSDYKSKEFPKITKVSNQNMSSKFLVPENLWVPIVYSNEIQFRFYLGKEGIDVKLTRKETSKLIEYFNRAIQMRDANLPPIPEGQKKW